MGYLVGRECEVAEADAECRKPILRALYEVAGPEILGIRASYQELVRTLAREWSAIAE